MAVSMGQKLSLRIDKIKDNDLKKSNSFCERICDDLCEELLRHLPLKDKVRLEKVCKQFQRTIFAKCYQLDVSLWIFWTEDVWDQSIKFNVTAFETIVKKCPNIESINLMAIVTNSGYREYKALIQLIIKYCHNLREIKCYFHGISDQLRQMFVNKFGTKLRQLKVLTISRFNCLNAFQNLRQLDIDFNYFRNPEVCALELPRLKKLQIVCRENSHFDVLNPVPIILEKLKSLEILKLQVFTRNQLILNSIFDRISKLHHLVELKFFTPIGLNHKLLKTSVRQMARNCPKLKTIRCKVTIDLNNFEDMCEMLSSLRPLKQLRQLDLMVTSDEMLEQNHLFSCKAFKGLEQLTHLTLFFVNQFVEDLIFEDIDLYLPKLKYLKIKNEMEATEWTHIMLSRLTELEVIYLDIIDDDMSLIIENKLRENCKKLQIIDIY